jgi:hypothetical protein
LLGDAVHNLSDESPSLLARYPHGYERAEDLGSSPRPRSFSWTARGA